MSIRIRATLVAVLSFVVALVAVPVAQANLLSILPGSCGTIPESQPFAPWGDNNSYFLVPGGAFATGEAPWALSFGARVEAGSLSLPSGTSATSPAVCTSIYDPTLRLFVENSGSSASRLRVEALYPGLLGGVQAARLGELSGTSAWQPSPQLQLTVTNLLATVSLQETAIAYRFTPQGSGGKWRIDHVYVDPRMK
jgi:hypothetical protein